MSLIQQAEVEDLKKQLTYYADLISKHQNNEAYSQRPQFHSVPYTNPGVYYKTKTVRPSNFSDLNVYKSKYHANTSSSRNPPYNIANSSFAQRNYSHHMTPVSVFPKQKTSCNVKQAASWKCNKASNSAQKFPNSSFKIVRPSSTPEVTESKTAKDVKFDNFLKPAAVPDRSEKNCSLSVDKDDLSHSKLIKGKKVSYVSCSDCVIEISEYENGELHISQKKSEPSVTNNKQSNGGTIGIPPTDISISESCLKKAKQEESATKASKMMSVNSLRSNEQSSVDPKPVIGPESCHTVYSLTEQFQCTEKSARSNIKKTDIKMACTDLSSNREFISSPCKLLKSQSLCTRDAKYSKINANIIKSPQNLVIRPFLKNKFFVKKSNVLSRSKFKTNEVKKCSPHRVNYSYVRKSLHPPPKLLPNSVAKRTALAAVKNVDNEISYSSCNFLDSLGQCHAKKPVSVQRKIHVTKSDLATSSFAQISRETKIVNLKNVYRVVNKSNLVANKIVKHSKIISSHLPKCDVHSSDKKWFANSTTGSKALADFKLHAAPQQNSSGKHLTKSGSKMMPYSKRTSSHKISSYKLRNILNGSEIVSHHSLCRVPQKKTGSKKTSLNPLYKSITDNHTPIKKAKKVRLSKTTYKVVNKHVNHVSQVVQMIKTKYRTVNKRSASNSHLKWLHEQKKTYLVRKNQKSPHVRTKEKWGYQHSASAGHFRKHGASCSETSRKHSLEQHKVLKKIRGVTYKVSKTKINKSVTPKAVMKNGFISCSNRKNPIIINVRGAKFQIAPGGKSLKKLGTKEQRSKIPLRHIKIGGYTYGQQKNSQTQNMASRMLHRSIHTVRTAEAKKTLQKNNMFCMFFNRFGRCNKGGNCHYVHDPSKIAVCTRFLRGTCKIDECPFSHEIAPGKMAVCSFFLQGNCTNNNCPYQHTSIKPGTRLCKAFVKGYCNSGSQCQEAHILACPQFICEGFCEKGSSCTWPHPPVRKNIRKGIGSPERNKENKEKDAAVDDINDLRYFTYEPGLVSDQHIKHVESFEDNTQEKVSKIRNKIKFHRQPEFIPLHVSDEKL